MSVAQTVLDKLHNEASCCLNRREWCEQCQGHGFESQEMDELINCTQRNVSHFEIRCLPNAYMCLNWDLDQTLQY